MIKLERRSIEYCDLTGELIALLNPSIRHSSLIITCPCWTPRLQLQWYNKALADTWYNFATCKINFCHKWCTTRFWMERLDNSDDISMGCELGQITRLKNQGVLSSQGQRGLCSQRSRKMFQGNKALSNNNREAQGTRDWLWWLLCWEHYRSLDLDKICTDINDSALPFKNHQTRHKL